MRDVDVEKRVDPTTSLRLLHVEGFGCGVQGSRA